MTEVQVGPVGMEQKKLGADLFCNGCGFAMMAEAKKQNLNMSVGMTERAFEEFISNLQKMRNAGNN
jgi:hypothetical protein